MDIRPSSTDPPHCLQHEKQLTVIEFYSGIGGVSYAFQKLNLSHAADITSLDINDVANEVHAFNFPDKRVLTRNLTGITASELDQYAADVWTMSPPCQPFTRSVSSCRMKYDFDRDFPQTRTSERCGRQSD
jgi:tRNA (cytosine38-C5)-methyltransferase